MNKLPSVLLYETISYVPETIGCVLCIDSVISHKVSSRVDVFHTMLEEIWGLHGIREQKFVDTMATCKDHLGNCEFYSYVSKTNKIFSYDLKTGNIQQHLVELPDDLPDLGLGAVLTPSPDRMFLYITGGIHSGTYVAKTIRISVANMDMERLAYFVKGRTAHAAEFCRGNLYIFGGFNKGSVLECEALENGAWSEIGNLRTGMEKPGAYAYKNEIFVSGYDSDHIAVYNAMTKSWRELSIQFEEPQNNSVMFGHRNICYVLRSEHLYELDLDSEEVLRMNDVTKSSWWSHTQRMYYAGKHYILHRGNDKYQLYEFTWPDLTEIAVLK